jgi:hypothetical protein
MTVEAGEDETGGDGYESRQCDATAGIRPNYRTGCSGESARRLTPAGSTQGAHYTSLAAASH